MKHRQISLVFEVKSKSYIFITFAASLSKQRRYCGAWHLRVCLSVELQLYACRLSGGEAIVVLHVCECLCVSVM